MGDFIVFVLVTTHLLSSRGGLVIRNQPSRLNNVLYPVMKGVDFDVASVEVFCDLNTLEMSPDFLPSSVVATIGSLPAN